MIGWRSIRLALTGMSCEEFKWQHSLRGLVVNNVPGYSEQRALVGFSGDYDGLLCGTYNLPDFSDERARQRWGKFITDELVHYKRVFKSDDYVEELFVLTAEQYIALIDWIYKAQMETLYYSFLKHYYPGEVDDSIIDAEWVTLGNLDDRISYLESLFYKEALHVK